MYMGLLERTTLQKFCTHYVFLFQYTFVVSQSLLNAIESFTYSFYFHKGINLLLLVHHCGGDMQG